MKLENGSVIDNKQSFLEVYEHEGRMLIRKTAKPGGEHDVRAQVDMYCQLPDHIAAHYPKIVNWDLESQAIWYEMELSELPTLRSLLFSSEVPAGVLSKRFAQVIRFLFGQQYRWLQGGVSEKYLELTYRDRMLRRLQELRRVDPFFARILEARSIVVCGREFENPITLVNRIFNNRSLLKEITPNFLCSIHGQMEFDHVLMDPESIDGSRFLLLDPRGISTLSDPAYDLGKIWQSCRSMIDLLEEERYRIDFTSSGTVAVFDFEFTLGPRVETVKEFYENTKKYITDNILWSEYPNLLLKSEFAEAVHICSGVPFYYDGPQRLKRALAGFVIGTTAFDEFAASYA